MGQCLSNRGLSVVTNRWFDYATLRLLKIGINRKYLLLVVGLFAGTLPIYAQERLAATQYCTFDGAPLVEDIYAFSADQDAVAAVKKVTDIVGLPLDIEIKAANIPAVAAVIEGNRKLLLYNTYFLQRLLVHDSTDWIAWGILSHEIAHLVLHPALSSNRERPLAELEADRLAGSVLYKLGAPLKQAQSAVTTSDGDPPAEHYPARSLRLAAVTEGWTNTDESTEKKVAFGSSESVTFEASHDFPRFWPPPGASTSVVIPLPELISSDGRPQLSLVAKRLEALLDAGGYGNRSYYAVPDGFALIGQLEQIHPDGTPKDPPDRWSLDVQPMRKFSLPAYFKALFTANPGHFRVIAFVVTSRPFSQQQAQVEAAQVQAWANGGLNTLPTVAGELPVTDHHTCTALIYEFELQTADHRVLFKDPSHLTAKTHLSKAQLWPGFASELE